jgi:hypothetical protein
MTLSLVLVICLASSCLQKTLSRLCLVHAASIYSDPSWHFVRDTIQHALGRHAYRAGEPVKAVGHFMELLADGAHFADGDSGHDGYLNDLTLALEVSLLSVEIYYD